MVEMLFLVLGLMIVMAAIPVIACLALMLAIAKRFIVRFNDPVEKSRFRVRLGGNVAYFIATLNALAVIYYFIAAGLPFGNRFDPWLSVAAGRLPEGWYLASAVAFLFAGFLLKITRSAYIAVFVLALFGAQIALEMSPTLFALAQDPGLFARFVDEITRLREAYASVGGIPGTIMATLFAGMVYGVLIQAAYYILTLASFLIALQGTLRLRRIAGQHFRVPPA
jgi:hypothetical protein